MALEVSICICTYKRSVGLDRVLSSLAKLVPETPDFEVIVVDNDAGKSGEPVAVSHCAREIPLTYLVEPVKNISRARNRTIAAARAELIAMIDDDEIADPRWLMHLYQTMTDYDADAVFGPVLPHFEHAPPKWIEDLKFFDYSVPATGREVPRAQMRTGNVLFRKSSVQKLGHPFDESLGLSGGEDTDLFLRLRAAGGKLIAAESAIVTETVPVERMGLPWLMRRHYRCGIGRISISLKRGEPIYVRLRHVSLATFKVGSRLAGSILWLPISRSRAARNFLQATYWFGVWSAFFGIRYHEYK